MGSAVKAPPETGEDEDELARRRREQQEREASADFDPAPPDAAAGNGQPGYPQPEDERPRSMEELEREAAEQAAADEEADGQFAFVVPETGRKISLGTLIPRNTPIKYAYKMSGKAIPNIRGGLIDPSDTDGLLLVTYVVEDVDVKFTRDADRKITAATIYIVLAPREVLNARSEAGEVLLRGE